MSPGTTPALGKVRLQFTWQVLINRGSLTYDGVPFLRRIVTRFSAQVGTHRLLCQKIIYGRSGMTAFYAQRAALTLGGNHVIASYSLLSSCCSSHSKSNISPKINKINKMTSGLFNSRTSQENPSSNGGAVWIVLHTFLEWIFVFARICAVQP